MNITIESKKQYKNNHFNYNILKNESNINSENNNVYFLSMESECEISRSDVNITNYIFSTSPKYKNETDYIIQRESYIKEYVNSHIQLKNSKYCEMVTEFIISDTLNISNYNSSITEDKNKKKLDDIRKLQYNWNDNEAEPIDKTICDNVLNIIYEVIIQPKIFPTANNSIQLEYYDDKDKNKYLEFEVFKDNINVYEVLSNLEEKSNTINPININKINSIIMDFYEINRK